MPTIHAKATVTEVNGEDLNPFSFPFNLHEVARTQVVAGTFDQGVTRYGDGTRPRGRLHVHPKCRRSQSVPQHTGFSSRSNPSLWEEHSSNETCWQGFLPGFLLGGPVEETAVGSGSWRHMARTFGLAFSDDVPGIEIDIAGPSDDVQAEIRWIRNPVLFPENGRLRNCRVSAGYAALGWDQLLNLLDGLRQTGEQSVRLRPSKSGFGLLDVAAEPPHTDNQLEFGNRVARGSRVRGPAALAHDPGRDTSLATMGPFAAWL
jgi:hypothetical protein